MTSLTRQLKLKATMDSNGDRSRRTAFRDGLSRVSPLLLGIFPFALIAGSTAASVGLDPFQGMGFSLFIFAGAAQLAALELIDAHAPIFIVLITAWIINIRMMIYSAAIAPHFSNLSRRWKMLLAYLLTDQAFVLSVTHYEHTEEPHKRWYYLGTAMGLWATWQSGSALGIALGARIPDSWSVDFAIPLTFIALLVPSIRDRVTLAAALAAGITVPLLAWLPMNLGFIAAIIVGITAATVYERSR